MVNCPLCNANIDVEEDELDAGDELNCEECVALLRVSDTDPLELESADDDDDDDDEDLDDFDDDDDDEEEAEEEEDDWR